MQELLCRLVAECRDECASGSVASYIPELSKADPRMLGVSVLTTERRFFQGGDASFPFTMQSISKVISLALAIEELGEEYVFERVGMDPTADPFNSIMRLEMVRPHRPQNPLINAGALVILSLLPYEDSKTRTEAVLALAGKLLGNNTIAVHEPTYVSEKTTSDRNRSLAFFLRSVGGLKGDVEDLLDTYFRQCSISVTTKELAFLGMVLALDGLDPFSGERLLRRSTARMLRALMATCGLYDGSGEFAVRVGIPAKSGVGGGIVAAVPGRMGIGVFGPALDRKGNSVGGMALLEHLSERGGLRVL
jgi:glutaminase